MTPVSTIRILLGHMPALLASIVDGLVSSEDDLEIVGRHVPRRSIFHEARRVRADVIVLQQREGSDWDDPLDNLLTAPPITVLTISKGGLGGELHRLVRERITFDAVTGGLVTAIRVAARGSA
jgi:chemotaxis response regulator CheB